MEIHHFLAPDWQPDIKLISSTVESYADEGDIIILVAHSAGGASTTEAVRDLSVEDRKAGGKPGGIERLVYLAAFAPELGVSPMTHEQVPGVLLVGSHRGRHRLSRSETG